jgi:hypothetical protein
MKILNIKPFDKETIIVELEGYPHALPCFPADISAKDLEVALQAWKINQDEVDAINKASREKIKPELTLSEDLKGLEGSVIDDKLETDK